MLAALLLPVVLHAIVAEPPARARLPADVPLAGLLELTRQGEVALLPAHKALPFNALLITRAKESCETVAHEMLDVETWPARWNIKNVEVTDRTPTSVRYRMKLDITLAPWIPGLIEHPSHDKVVFNDPATGAQFIWTLDDMDGGGCAMRYSLLETPGKPSPWVSVLTSLESSIGDAANFAAAISSARGFAHPETRGATSTATGDEAFATLAAHGTALRVVRDAPRFPVIVVRRVVERPIDDVLWSLRDKHSYPDKIAVMNKVKDHGSVCAYTVGTFGGRVSWDTSVVEEGDAHTAGGLTLREKVTGGDLPARGGWVWRIRPVAGGTDVELSWDLDITPGSALMNTLGETDPQARESLAIHMALAFMGDLVGGKPLGQRTLARAQ